MVSRRGLAVELSSLKGFENPCVKLEQYTTPSDIAADVLWHAYMKGRVSGKRVVDLCCGSGILGVGALLLGASRVDFVDVDSSACSVCSSNLSGYEFDGEYDVVLTDGNNIDIKADLVLMNPPFGTKEKNADRGLLLSAMRISDVVYSFHKTSTRDFVYAVCRDNGFLVEEELRFSFMLKKTFSFHKKAKENIDVTCFVLVRSNIRFQSTACIMHQCLLVD